VFCGHWRTAGHDDGRASLVNLLQHSGDVAHHALEFLRHVVDRAVREHHGIFEQAVRVNIGQQTGHGEPLFWWVGLTQKRASVAFPQVLEGVKLVSFFESAAYHRARKLPLRCAKAGCERLLQPPKRKSATADAGADSGTAL
jgi:hypothetical protein